jgi:hypothetical protein
MLCELAAVSQGRGRGVGGPPWISIARSSHTSTAAPLTPPRPCRRPRPRSASWTTPATRPY